MKIHQLLMGRDLALDRTNAVHSMAAQMSNFCYVIDLTGGRCILVDCAWDVDGVLQYCSKHALDKVECAVFTHRHLDHTGGTFSLRRGAEKATVPGLKELALRGIPIKMGLADVDFTVKQTGVTRAEISSVQDLDEIVPGISVLHTPGHTPGSICLLIGEGGGAKQALITGDTLFIDSCGRTDLPESSFADMQRSLARLAKLPKECIVLPGHDYASVQQSSIERERARNFPMRQAMQDEEQGAGLKMQPTSAGSAVLLPDYLEAAQRALVAHAQHNH